MLSNKTFKTITTLTHQWAVHVVSKLSVGTVKDEIAAVEAAAHLCLLDVKESTKPPISVRVWHSAPAS